MAEAKRQDAVKLCLGLWVFARYEHRNEHRYGLTKARGSYLVTHPVSRYASAQERSPRLSIWQKVNREPIAVSLTDLLVQLLLWLRGELLTLTVNLPLWERKRDLGRTNGLIKRSAPLADTPEK